MPPQSGPHNKPGSSQQAGVTSKVTPEPLPTAVEHALKGLGLIALRVKEDVYVKGGVACYYHTILQLGHEAKYLALRPVSLDIDWTCKSDHVGANKHLAILTLASEQLVTFTEDLEQYKHITFGSKIGRGKMKVGDTFVELDLIPTCRFAPDPSRYMYEFGIEASPDSKRTPKAPFDGVRLNSREVVLCEKLGLGRGSDMNKFDIVDSALLLALAPLSTASIESVIAQQVHRDFFDGPYLISSRRDAVAASIRQSGLVGENVLSGVSTLSGGSLKQLALTARLAESLSKVDDSTLATFFTEETPVGTRERLQLQLADNVQLLKGFLRSKAEALLGKS